MPTPDHNSTIAAALYGFAVEHVRTSKKASPTKKEGSGEESVSAVQDVFSGNWNDASTEERAPFLKATRFLSSWSRSSNLEQLDRDNAATALAAQLKGTTLEGIGFSYRAAVEIFANTLQALRA